jgi:hypothetical protein
VGPRVKRRAAILALGALFHACGARQAGPERARVRFEIEPQEARVYSDERFVGSARLLSQRPVVWSTGRRRVTIGADGYFPHDVMLELPAGESTVRVRLRPIPR